MTVRPSIDPAQLLEEQLAQASPAAGNPRAYGADRHPENVGDFFVAEVFDVAEDHGFAEGRVEPRQRLFESASRFTGLSMFFG